MAEHGAEVGVDWVSGLVLHEGDADWHPWDEAVYGPRPGSTEPSERHEQACACGMVGPADAPCTPSGEPS